MLGKRVLDIQHIALEPIRPLLRSEYEQMVELGHFENERIELLHGVLVTMSPQGALHASVIAQINRILVRRLPDHAWVRPQLPLGAANDSEPEPDLAVIADSDHSEKHHPTTALLVIEVADSSLQADRDIKIPLYATSGIPEYWIVNLVDSVVEVHTMIENGRYTHTARYNRTGAITLVEFPDIKISVSDFLPES